MMQQAPAVGKMLGRYLVEQRLAEGGMGVVYRARDLRLGRPVALKLLGERLRADETAWGWLLAEARTASLLNHPHICTIYEVGEEDGQAYISMEYVEGEPLSLLAMPQGMPVETVIRYGAQITDALAHAHERGIVHRDVKSANVMITRGGWAKVLDFGLARRLPEGELTQATTSHASLRELGAIAGTLPYLAPEVLRGKPASVPSDIWSLGVLLYEITTGTLPFQGQTAFELSLAIMASPPKPWPAEVPAGLHTIVERCLEKDPTRRYASAREVLSNLEALNVPSVDASVSARLPARRGLLPAAAALLLAAALALAIASLRSFILRTPPQTAAIPSGVPALAQGKFIAVLPFRVLGDQASLNYIAEGLVEALDARLFQVKKLHVTTAATVEKASSKKPLDKVAAELGINLAVIGVVEGAGDQVQVIVSLQDIGGKRRLWTHEFSGGRQDLLKMEDEIFVKLVAALGLGPSDEEAAESVRRPTEEVQAYDLYLRGRDASRRFEDAENIAAAVGFYEEALKKDPGFALAYAGLADASLEMYGIKNDSFWSERALHAAEEAVRLNHNLAEAHMALGSVNYATGEAKKAINEFKLALELKSASDVGYRRLGSAYLATGRKDEAIRAYLKAIQLNPYEADHYHVLGYAYLDLGENEKALGTFRRMIELEPDNAAGYEDLGLAYFRQGRWNECIPEFEKALALQPYYTTYSNLGLAYFYLKRYDEATKMFEKAVELNPNEEITVGNLADAYRWSGDGDKARSTYDRAISLAYSRLRVNRRDASTLGSLALYYAKQGDCNRALDFIHQARSINHTDVELIYIEAVVRNLAGHPQEALQALREALQRGYSPEEAENDPELAGLQTLPGFRSLVEQFIQKLD